MARVSRKSLVDAAEASKAPALGITGTGGAGKSSLTDELVLRLPPRPGRSRCRIAIISIDPSRSASPAARCSATASA